MAMPDLYPEDHLLQDTGTWNNHKSAFISLKDSNNQYLMINAVCYI